MPSERSTEVNEHYEVLGIRECTRCGDTGDENQKYGVDGIARIAGNLCVDCVRELDDRFTEKRAVTDGGRDQSAVGVDYEFNTESHEIVCTDCGTHPRLQALDKNSGTMVECDCDDVKKQLDSVPYEYATHNLPDSWEVQNAGE